MNADLTPDLLYTFTPTITCRSISKRFTLLKKIIYTAIPVFLLCCFVVKSTTAQVTFNLTDAQITGQQDQTISQASGSFLGSLLLGSLDYASTTGTGNFVTTAGSPDLPLSVAHVRVNSIGTINLGGARPEITLSSQSQSLYAWLLNIGAGALTLNFRLGIAGTAWNAGTYTSVNSLTYTTPATQTLTINVPSFLTVNTSPANVVLNVASLANFRSGSLTGSHSFDHSTSLATDLKLKSNLPSFTFSTTHPKIADPAVTANSVQAALTSPTGGSTISLAATDQALSTNIPVQATNRRSMTTQFSVNAASLKASIAQAGTYTLPLSYTLAKHTTANGTALSASTPATLQIVVPRLFEFIVPMADVLLNINSVSTYRNGVTVVSAPFMLSSTVPYNLSVSASGDFTNGSGATIPANTVVVEGIASETGVVTVALTNTAQTLISGASPVIDRNLRLQYRIPADRTTNLLGKTAGTYQSTITYTFTAP